MSSFQSVRFPGKKKNHHYTSTFLYPRVMPCFFFHHQAMVSKTSVITTSPVPFKNITFGCVSPPHAVTLPAVSDSVPAQSTSGKRCAQRTDCGHRSCGTAGTHRIARKTNATLGGPRVPPFSLPYFDPPTRTSDAVPL